MRFTPMSDEEIKASMYKPWPAGEYPFEVLTAEDKLSKSGNEMIQLNLLISSPDDKQTRIFDFLLESMQFKLKHFCEATGLIDKYNAGEFTSRDALGKYGKCVLKIQPARNGYPEKNAIEDYVKLQAGEAPAQPMPSNSFSNGVPLPQAPEDDLPF